MLDEDPGRLDLFQQPSPRALRPSRLNKDDLMMKVMAARWLLRGKLVWQGMIISHISHLQQPLGCK
jgi:hypothetical protein